MIQEIDRALGRRIAAELARIPGCLVIDPQQVTFETPGNAESNRDGMARVNLYLFDLHENLARREAGVARIAEPGAAALARSGKRHAATRIDLAYLVTVHAGGDPMTEHRLLSDIFTALLRLQRFSLGDTPSSSPEMSAPAGAEAATVGRNETITLSLTTPEQAGLTDPKGLWSAFGTPLRPALLVVATAPVDPWDTVWHQRVRAVSAPLFSATDGVGPTREEANAAASVTAPALDARRRPAVVAPILGIVLDQKTETPLAGAQVDALPADAARTEAQTEAAQKTDDGTEVIASAQTTAEGLFLLRGLSAGPLQVRVTQLGYEIIRVSAEAVRLPAGATVADAARIVAQQEPLVIALRAAQKTL